MAKLHLFDIAWADKRAPASEADDQSDTKFFISVLLGFAMKPVSQSSQMSVAFCFNITTFTI